MSFQNFFHFYFDSIHKTLLNYSITNFLFINKMESSLKQREKEKVTSIKSLSSKDFLKDPFFISILIYSWIIMSYLGLSKKFLFETTNITNYFDSYNQICIDYQVNKKVKIKWLS